MGYSGDAPMESAYRNSRAGRIYSGSNEYIKMLFVSNIIKVGIGDNVLLRLTAVKI